jgi:hypothetical protein
LPAYLPQRQHRFGWVENQGPIGQAHFAESVFPLEHGAAYKCPTDARYLNDWCCIAGRGTDLVINTIFGANLTLFAGIGIQSHLTDSDPKARLVNMRYQAWRSETFHELRRNYR